MKVIKCLDHIPKELWGSVLKDQTTQNFCKTYNHIFVIINYLNDGERCEYELYLTDTFPLPEQGDKVEVSDDGKNWSEHCNWYFLSYLNILSDPFIVYDDDKDIPSSFKYIRPIEGKKEIAPSSQTIKTVLEYLMVKID